MKKVVFRPRAENDLIALYNYIAVQSGNHNLAFEIMWRLRAACISLADFPERGVQRDDIIAGLRILIFERRNIVAYRIMADVEILAIFGAGQDWFSLFQIHDDFENE